MLNIHSVFDEGFESSEHAIPQRANLIELAACLLRDSIDRIPQTPIPQTLSPSLFDTGNFGRMDGDHRALPEKGQVKILWSVAINKSDFHFG
jgi:hypothetical protein